METVAVAVQWVEPSGRIRGRSGSLYSAKNVRFFLEVSSIVVASGRYDGCHSVTLMRLISILERRREVSGMRSGICPASRKGTSADFERFRMILVRAPCCGAEYSRKQGERWD